MAQVARDLTDHIDGFRRSTRYLIVDRDSKFTEQFSGILRDAGGKFLRTCYQTPDMNAFAERWGQSVKRECRDRVILFGGPHLRRVLAEYLPHCHHEPPHQGLGNEPSAAPESPRSRSIVMQSLKLRLRSGPRRVTPDADPAHLHPLRVSLAGRVDREQARAVHRRVGANPSRRREVCDSRHRAEFPDRGRAHKTPGGRPPTGKS